MPKSINLRSSFFEGVPSVNHLGNSLVEDGWKFYNETGEWRHHINSVLWDWRWLGGVTFTGAGLQYRREADQPGVTALWEQTALFEKDQASHSNIASQKDFSSMKFENTCVMKPDHRCLCCVPQVLDQEERDVPAAGSETETERRKDENGS